MIDPPPVSQLLKVTVVCFQYLHTFYLESTVTPRASVKSDRFASIRRDSIRVWWVKVWVAANKPYRWRFTNPANRLIGKEHPTIYRGYASQVVSQIFEPSAVWSHCKSSRLEYAEAISRLFLETRCCGKLVLAVTLSVPKLAKTFTCRRDMQKKMGGGYYWFFWGWPAINLFSKQIIASFLGVQSPFNK